MVLKNKISTVIKQTFFYSSKVWLVNICFFVIILSSIFDRTSNSFFDFKTIIALTILYSFPSMVIFSCISYKMLCWDKLNHWIKKVLLLFCYLLLVLLSSFIVLGKNDYDGTPFFLIFSILFGLPSLISIGLFFPDRLDEYLKTHKNTEGVK